MAISFSLFEMVICNIFESYGIFKIKLNLGCKVVFEMNNNSSIDVRIMKND